MYHIPFHILYAVPYAIYQTLRYMVHIYRLRTRGSLGNGISRAAVEAEGPSSAMAAEIPAQIPSTRASEASHRDYMGVSQNWGSLLGGSYSKDYIVLGGVYKGTRIVGTSRTAVEEKEEEQSKQLQ